MAERKEKRCSGPAEEVSHGQTGPEWAAGHDEWGLEGDQEREPMSTYEEKGAPV